MIANIPVPSQAVDQVDEQIHGRCGNKGENPLSSIRRQSLTLLGEDNEMDNDIPAFTSNDRMSFPLKLYQMLSQASSEANEVGHSFEDIVSWEPHGKSFVIRDAEKFSTIVMPRFFSFAKISCFRRLLQVHGFSNMDGESSLTAQDDTYCHKMFKRGRPRLLTCLVRRKNSLGLSRTKMAPRRASNATTTCATTSEERADAAAISESSDSENSEDHDEASTVSTPEQDDGDAPQARDEQSQDMVQEASQGEMEFQASLWGQEIPSPELSDAKHDEMLLDFLEDVFVADEKTNSMSNMALDASPVSRLPQKSHMEKLKVVSPGTSESSVGGLTKVSALPPLGAMNAGPLRIPGRLRNGFGFGIKATCFHSVAKGQSPRGSMVKTICVDLTSRDESVRQERTRFQKPLETAISSSELEHIIWKSPFEEPERVCSKGL